jgi:hypothetical protein
MSQRPDFSPDQVLSPQQLVEVRQNFAKLSVPSLQTAYSEALERVQIGSPRQGSGVHPYPGACAGVEAVEEGRVSDVEVMVPSRPYSTYRAGVLASN